jgi:pimeloyl-ACP methyl ester carboxylesterase
MDEVPSAPGRRRAGRPSTVARYARSIVEWLREQPKLSSGSPYTKRRVPLRLRATTLGALVLLGLVMVAALAPAPVGSLPRRGSGRRGSGQGPLAREWHNAECAWLIATGRLVDVGGYRLRVDCYGRGDLTVVLEAGLCQTRATWGRVVGDIASFARVCSYDRAGLGESDSAPGPRTPRRVVEDLERVLVATETKAPYVLVGHSFGGLAVRLYAARHPERVRGLILIDASHEEQYARLADLMEPQDRAAFLKHEGGGNCEALDLLAAARELQAAGPPPAVPLVVLTARPRWTIAGCPDNAVRAELQAKLARLSPSARHAIAERSGHFIQLDRPDVVTAAVREVAGAVAVAVSDRAASGGPR